MSKIMAKTLGAAFIIFFIPNKSWSQQSTNPKNIDIASQADVIGDVASKYRSAVVLRPKLVIDGDYYATTMLVGAKEIIFKANSKIILNDATPNTAGAFFVVADIITVEDPSKPGTITWKRQSPTAPPDRGQAGAGGPGGSDGAPGGPGAGGAAGTTGTIGRGAPAVTLMVRSVANGGLVIDAQGDAGGPGGMGQAGGNGGPGAQGSPARQARHNVFGATLWDPWCESGPGQGGSGGVGGPGGVGGTGGQGGDGGNVTIVTLPDRASTIFTAVRVLVGGGPGGQGGPGGTGGQGGPGGSEGQLANFCNSAGRHGGNGGTGSSGAIGQIGSPGRAGQPFVAQLTAEQFRDLFGM